MLDCLFFPVFKFDLLTFFKVALGAEQDVVEGLVREVALQDLIDLSSRSLAVLETHESLSKHLSDHFGQVFADSSEDLFVHVLLSCLVLVDRLLRFDL